MASELTIKQQRFVKHYVTNGGNGTQAVLQSYDTDDENYAAVQASRLIRNDKVKSSIEADLAAENLHPRRLAAKLNKLIDHERTLISPSGEVVGKEADANVQLKAVDLTAKLLGLFPNSQGGGGLQQHLHSHLHLADESGAILAWIAANKRLPSEAERRQILEPEPQQVVVEAENADSVNEPDKQQGE